MIPLRIKEIKIENDYCIEIHYVNGEKRLYNMEKFKI